MASGTARHQITPDEVTVVVDGPVPDRMRAIAQEKVSSATRLSGRNIVEATVTLRELSNRTSPEPSRAEVALRIPRAIVRAVGDGATPNEALDLAVARIERRIVDQINRWDDRSRWTGVIDQQRRAGSESDVAQRVGGPPPDERQVVRRKTFAIAPATVDEAAYDMQAVGHDFYMFNDAASGQPAVIYRDDASGFHVSGLADDAVLPHGVHADPAPPTLDETAARRRLDDGGEPFVFFIDRETRQGNVLYRRRDGHYGLITST
jgi:ribosome-associated translation inhibitor RaiA